jgi:hypothetical protein
MTARTKINWRVKGGCKPPNVVDVSRWSGIAPAGWGNPFKVAKGEDPRPAVENFRKMVEANPAFQARIRTELRGKVLACYCKADQACHGDVLVEFAEKSI